MLTSGCFSEERGLRMNYIDLHCDTAWKLFESGGADFFPEYAECAGKFGIYRQVFAFFVPDGLLDPWDYYCRMYRCFTEKLPLLPGNVSPLFALENGASLGRSTERLIRLKRDGMVYITLSWNGENPIAGGVNSTAGLSRFGERIIEQMNRLEMGCDLSHLNEKSFSAAVELADFPLASHSNCFEICPHKRNLKLCQIQKIAQKGGVVGLCFYPAFLGEGDPRQKILENIRFLCANGLEDAVAIGSDFDGGEMDDRLDCPKKVPDLYAYLLKNGIKRSLADKIFYQNAQNLLQKIAKRGMI